MGQTTKCAPMDSSFPHSSAHVSLGPRRMDHWQYFPTHQKYLAIDRGSFVGSKMIVFTRWKHTNFHVGCLRRQRKIWFSSHFWVSISSSFRKLTILNFNLAFEFAFCDPGADEDTSKGPESKAFCLPESLNKITKLLENCHMTVEDAFKTRRGRVQ